MTRSLVPPVDTVLASHCLKLRQFPIEWIATHGLKQLRGSIHGLDDTAGNITAQMGERLQVRPRKPPGRQSARLNNYDPGPFSFSLVAQRPRRLPDWQRATRYRWGEKSALVGRRKTGPALEILVPARLSALEAVPEVTVGRAFHYGLRAREFDARRSDLGDVIVKITNQECA